MKNQNVDECCVALSGHFGENNVGDDILLLALVKGIAPLPHVREVVVFTADLQKTSELFEREKLKADLVRLVYSGRWGLREPNKPLLKSLSWPFVTVRALKKSNLHLIGPGTIIKDSNNAFFLLFWLWRALLSSVLRRPFAFIGIGVGHIRFFHSKIFLRLIAKKAKFITTRDSISLAQLKNLHVASPRMESYPDLSFAEDFSPVKTAAGVTDIRKVGLNFRKFKGKHFPADKIDRYQEAIVTLLLNIPRTIELVFYSFCNESHQSDLEMYEAISRQVGKNCVRMRNFEYQTLSELRCDIQTCDVFIGTRFHSVLLAVQSGVPTIGLSYEQKTVNFMQDAGLGAYALDISDIRAEAILHLWEKAVHNYSEYKDQVTGLTTNLRIQALRHFEEVASALSQDF